MFGDDKFFDQQVQQHSAGASNSYVHVLLHSTNGDHDPNDQPVQCAEPFQLTDRMWICRLPNNLRNIVYDACESPGVRSERPFRQYGQLYTIALFAGPWAPGELSAWDAHNEITRFVTLSQLVHPTSIGFANSARLSFNPNGDFISADPGPCRGITEYAFTVPHHRNWISKPECESIKHLLTNSNLKELPDKVARAHWNIQHAAYQYFFEVRALLVVSGLEALLHTRTQKSKRPKSKLPRTGEQFVRRTQQLATLLGISFTRDDVQAVWDHRSDVVHGRDPWAARQNAGQLQRPSELTKDNQTVNRYLQAEHVLRSAVLTCLTDPQFASKFTSDSSVDKNFRI